MHKSKCKKILSSLLSINMLFGMSLTTVRAVGNPICEEQNFENVSTAEEAGWKWLHDEPKIASNIGDNTGKALTLDTNTTDGSEMIYSFTTKYRFTLKMKLYMSNENAGTYLRFVNSNNDSMDITYCGLGSNVYQEGSTTVRGTYTNGWNDVEITVDPVLKTFSFRLGNVTLNETTGTNVPSTFFDYDIASFKVIKVKDGDSTTVAVDDFSITAEDVFEWNGEEATLPKNTYFRDGLTDIATYVTDAFGDKTKGNSLAIGTVAGDSPMLQLSPIFGDLTGNTAFSYSFDLGIDSFSAARTTYPSYYFQFFENTNLMGDDNYGFSIDANGLITFFGKATDTSLSDGAWHNIKYVMASNGANTKQNASLYIDGNYVTSATLNIWKPEAASKIDRLRFCNNSTSSTMYVDNVKLERLETPLITSEDEEFAGLINTDDYQICAYDMTVRDFLDKTTGAVVIKDGNKAPLDALLKECLIFSETAGGDRISYRISWSIVQINKDMFEENFDSLTLKDLPINNKTDIWYTYQNGQTWTAYTKCTTISQIGGFGGKEENDKCIVIQGDSITRVEDEEGDLWDDAFIQINFPNGMSSQGQVTTIDADIYVDGEQDAKIHNRDGDMVAEFLNDGTVKICRGEISDFNWKDETTKDSKWMRISICIDTITKHTTLLVNNKIVGVSQHVYTMPEYRFASFYDKNGQSGVLAVDNVNIYEGLPKDYGMCFDCQVNSGSCDVTAKVKYADDLQFMSVIAQYDADNRFLDVSFGDYTLSDPETMTESIKLNAKAKKIKAFAWKKDFTESYINCTEFSVN